MLGFDRSLVEHHLPIKVEFQPFSTTTMKNVQISGTQSKEGIEKLLKVKFIWPTR